MAQLQFSKKKNYYESNEFKVNGNFNLHVERKKDGKFILLQKTSGTKFAVITSDRTMYNNEVIDVDIQILLPKTIKIISFSEIDEASYTESV